MSTTYQSHDSTQPSRVDNAYILSLIATTGDGLAAITSASELLMIDRQHVTSQPTFFREAPSNVNCLIRNDATGQSLVCSSSDGSVTTFDVRSQKKVAQFQADRSVTALASDGLRIGVGTELKSQQAIVSLWDARQNREIWRNGENNDDITVVAFHPENPDVLLAGGDDGLAINHGPVHKAGFLDSNRIFALSSDQNLAIYPISTPDEAVDPPPVLVGDLRPLLPCQYAIDVVQSGSDHVLAAGTNLEASRVDLVKLNPMHQQDRLPVLDLSSRIVLEPAHGEEIVRAIVVDDQTGAIFTAGEDGRICVFKQDSELSIPPAPASKGTKSKRGVEGRYKPY